MIARQHITSLVLRVGLLAALGQWGLAPLFAEQPLAESVDSTLRFRRMYVPEDGKWPLDPGVRYRPILKSDFERLIELLGSGSSETTAAAVRIEAAHHQVVLEDDLLRGQARLEIVRSARQPAAAGASTDRGALLSLAPLSVAVERAVWEGDPQQSAVFGLDETNQPAVIVARSGTLLLDWSLQRTRTVDDRVQFDLELPLAPVHSLDLRLPAELSLVASRGVLVGARPTENDQRAWRLELGGRREVQIALSAPAEVPVVQRPALVRQSSTYSFWPRGLDVTVQLTIDATTEPVRQIEVKLDRPLQLLAARQGENQVPWSAAPTRPDEPQHIVLELPQPLTGTGNVVRLGATAPMVMGQLWKLPTVQAQDLFWQDGRATLLFPKPLKLERLVTTHCRQTSTGPLPPPSAGESVGIQSFVPTASMEVVVSHAAEQLRVASAAQIEITEETIQGEVVSDLSISDGRLFALSANVPQQWTIDSVESVPPGRLQDWSLDSPASGQRSLEIQLAQAVTPNLPLRLAIGGRRLNLSDKPVLAADLQMLEFKASHNTMQILSLDCPDNFHLQVTGDDPVSRLDPQQLPDDAATLFAEPPSGLTFRLDERAARLEVALKRHAPLYTAAIEVETVATAGPLWETYTIHCRPQSSRLERLLVHFSHARSEPLRWALGSEGEAALSARRLSDEELSASGKESGETWELVLRRPRTTPFDIRATRAVAITDQEEPISLMSLPGASSQQGQLTVRSTNAVALEINNRSLQPLSVDPQTTNSAQRSSILRGAFRYQPGHDALAPYPPAIALTRKTEGTATAGSFVWKATLESRYEPDGHGHHVAIWQVQNEGRDSLTVKLPDAAQDVSVWIDGTRQHGLMMRAGKLALDLPTGHVFSSITIAFLTRETPLGILTALAPPKPEVDLPVMSGEWMIWLPPGYVTNQVADGLSREGHSFDPLWRLFGPLAAGGNQRSAYSFAHSGSGLLVAPLERRAAGERMEQVLRQFGDAWVEDGHNSPSRRDWGALVRRLETELEATNLTLLIDDNALTRAGIWPHSGMSEVESATGDDGFLAALMTSDSALLLHEDAVLLTSQQAAATLRQQLEPLDHPALHWVRTGTLHHALSEAVDRHGSANFSLASQWAAGPVLPWPVHRESGFEPVDVHGWSAYRLDLMQSPRHLYVVRQSTIHVLAWSLFLAVVTLAWRTSDALAPRIALTGGAMVAALVLPTLFVPLASSVVLALLFCLIVRLTRRPRASGNRQTGSSGVYTLENRPTTVLLLLAIAVAGSRGALAMEAATAENDSSPVHKVFIPVDADGELSGQHYWVPEELYAQLQRRADRISRAPRGWMLEDPHYRAIAHWDVAQQKLLIPEIKASFDLRVFEAPCRVTLPMGSAGNGAAGRLLLDGALVAADWDQEGLISFEVGEIGRYRVEVDLPIEVSSNTGLSSIDLLIPPHPTARLEVHLPRTAPEIEVTSALGTVELNEDSQRLTADLGGTARLTARWRDGAGARRVRPLVEADQLLWLRTQSGSVTAHVKVKCRVLEGSIRQVQLAIDPRWQLQPDGEEANELVAQVKTVAGTPNLLQFDLARPVTEHLVLEATLRLSTAAGIGNLRIPNVKPLGMRSVRHFLAVSVDPVLDYKEDLAEPMTPLTPAEFVAQWGESESPPQLAYRMPSHLPRWSLAVRPRPVQSLVDSLLAVSCAAERAMIRFDATIDSSGPCFQYRVSVPTDMAIESVMVLEDVVDRLARYSRNEDGALTLFLTEPAADLQQVVIQGSMALPRRGPWKLPEIRVQQAEFRSAQVRIYRQPLQQVEVRDRNGLIEQLEQRRALENQNPDFDKEHAGMGRLVSLMTAESPSFSARLNLKPNRPRFTASQVTSLVRQSSGWQVEVDCQLQIASGIVDLLRLEIPASWQGPFQVTPPAAVSRIDHAGESGQQVIIRPHAVPSGEYRFKIRAPLVPDAGESLEAPIVTLQGAQRLERLLVLPTQVDLQPVTWEIRGLAPVDLPEDIDAAAAPGLAAYQVVDDAVSAVLQAVSRPVGEPQVYLADLSVSCQGDGAFRGVAAFDLDPAGNAVCPLWLPEKFRLHHVSVNGIPATLLAKGDHNWQIGLGSDQLPQRIEVVFQGQLMADEGGSASWSVLMPQLGDLAVQNVLWTVQAPRTFERSAANSVRPTNELRQELARLKSIAAVMNLAPAILPNEAGEEIAAWYAPWARRYVASMAAVRRELLRTRDSDTVRTVESELRFLEQEQSQIARRLGMPQSMLRGAATLVSAEQPRHLWNAVAGNDPSPRRYISTGPIEPLLMDVSSPAVAQWLPRIVWALAVLAATAGVIASLRSPYAEWLFAWRHLAAVAAGLAWWWWLSPSLLGWLIVGASLLAMVRDRRQPRHDNESTIVRLSTASHS